ncbi:putative membrane protein [Microbacterium trichothecenolyticum]|uniref:hypothetical protein n=1 Tax=Microbacterium trichothecenolyticum TaxID=69370 RepID=UPI00285BC2BC|nr:hypothetical protein [Microbacterium trichothecenolyticum]MDR7184908.1 putative membrane protein [Microbacterium trichothecenolyticum]
MRGAGQHIAVFTAATFGVAAVTIVALQTPMLGVAALLGAAFMLWAWKYTRAAGVLWVTALAIIPQWWSVSVPSVGAVPLTAALGIALALVVLANGTGRSRADTYVVVYAVLVVAAVGVAWLATSLPMYVARDYLLVWILPVFLGARLAPAMRSALPVVGAVVGACSVLELALGLHVFETLGEVSSWQSIQERGGWDRSEGAFGTPIALGAFLVLCLPFIAEMKRHRTLAAALIIGGTIATISRSPIIALLVTGLMLIRRHATVKLIAASFVGAVVVYLVASPLLASDDAASDAAGSDQYRFNAIASTIATMRPIGLAAGAVPDAVTGSLRFAGFNSIDSAILLNGLVLGWLPVVVALIALVPVVATVILTRRGSAEEIALVGQLFMIGSLAFITGWQYFVFVIVGMVLRVRADRRQERQSEITPSLSVPIPSITTRR